MRDWNFAFKKSTYYALDNAQINCHLKESRHILMNAKEKLPKNSNTKTFSYPNLDFMDFLFDLQIQNPYFKI